MPQPRLLLIDDEPVLPNIRQRRAKLRLRPIVTARDEDSAKTFIELGRKWSRSTWACRSGTASN